METVHIFPVTGKKSYTRTLQDAIDFCSRSGGGTVYVEKGTYQIETVFLRSNIRLFLAQESVIKGNPDVSGYSPDVHHQMYAGDSHMDRCLFFADRCENIVLDGYGTIDGSGRGKAIFDSRPMLFRYLECRNIRIENVRMTDPCSWTNAFIGCENIWVRGIQIDSSHSWNGDGLDFDGCRNVFVSDCLLDCGDDCICLQNSYFDRPCENITVSGCTFRTRWAGMRIGLLSCGPIRNLTVTNCIFREINCSGLKIQSAEGSVVENLVFSNLIMENVVRPAFITANRFRERAETETPIMTPSIVRNIRISNMISRCTDPVFLANKEDSPTCITLDCTPGNLIEHIAISAVAMFVAGIPDYIPREEIPMHINKRAEYFNYEGLLPAYGLYARNVRNLRLNDFQVFPEGEDRRERIFCCSCSNVYEEEIRIK